MESRSLTGLGFRFGGLGSRFWVQGLGFRYWGLGFRGICYIIQGLDTDCTPLFPANNR